MNTDNQFRFLSKHTVEASHATEVVAAAGAKNDLARNILRLPMVDCEIVLRGLSRPVLAQLIVKLNAEKAAATTAKSKAMTVLGERMYRLERLESAA